MDEQPTSQLRPIRLGIDIGGTFTDFVVYDSSNHKLKTFKLLSTPHDPAEAVLSGLTWLLETLPLEASSPGEIVSLKIVHGSTVATNALLERKGARTAFVATRGFKDVLEIGRQNRPELYNLQVEIPPPLVPGALRFEIDERVDAGGSVIRSPSQPEISALMKDLTTVEPDSIAICLLFSFLHPDHEQSLAEKFRGAGYSVSVSSEILPEYREYERASTTAVNAYVSPILDRYLSHLETASHPGVGNYSWRVMQSNGGNMSIDEARRVGVRCILSGPAGGVTGAYHLALISGQLAKREQASRSTYSNQGYHEGANPVRLITFDMGGTSTDVSLIDGAPSVTTESSVGGCPIRVPVLDIHTIGAGGGSIAYVDAGGALRVGPQSAGADPGPACYARVEVDRSFPTVTDANLVLGRLSPQYFLGGALPLDQGRADYVLTELGTKLGLDKFQAALGVIEVANTHMERALRVISVERGHDPRDFVLFSFGGAGGLHAADLARRLGVPQVIIPPIASTMSAFGMLCAHVVKDYVQTVMVSEDNSLETLATGLDDLGKRGLIEVTKQGVPPAQITLEKMLDVRYFGQSYELTIPYSPHYRDAFHQAHHREYGYARTDAPIQVVNIRLRATGRIEPPNIEAMAFTSQDSHSALLETRQVVFPTDILPARYYIGESLLPGNQIQGPAVIVRADTTILLGPSDSGEIDGLLNLLITVGV